MLVVKNLPASEDSMICLFCSSPHYLKFSLYIGDISCGWPLCPECQEPGTLQGRCLIHHLEWMPWATPPRGSLPRLSFAPLSLHPEPYWRRLTIILGTWRESHTTPEFKVTVLPEMIFLIWLLGKATLTFQVTVQMSLPLWSHPWLHKGELISLICNPITVYI